MKMLAKVNSNNGKKSITYISLVIIALGILLGSSLYANQFMFYNILIMPAIGGIAYFSLKKKSVYVCVAVFIALYVRCLYDSFGYVLNGSFAQAFVPPLWWALIYLVLTVFGVFVVALLYYGFKKEPKNKIAAKMIAIIVAVTLIVGLLLVANAFVGNPISKVIVKYNAKQYIEKTYPNTDYYVDDVIHSFKTGGYYAEIKSPSSEDTYFSVSYNSFGEFDYDNFSSYVSDRFNTWDRINSEYRTATDEVFLKLPYESDINYGEIQTLDKENGTTAFGLDMSELELDKDYNLEELGSKFGKLTLYVYTDEITDEKANEVLLQVKKQFDEANQSFYAIDLVLRHKRNEAVKDWQDDETIRLDCFLYSDITEDK